jgi:hypothetical protein
VLFAVLLVLVWTTMDGSEVLVAGREVDLRWLPTLVLGLFAFKAIIHRQHERE